MRFTPVEPPREFVAGVTGVRLRDCARIELEAGELVTFVTPEGREVDFTATAWGFYPLPSLDGRLAAQGFRTALVRNGAGKHFVNVVARDQVAEFEAYLAAEQNTLVEWLDARE